MPLERNVTASTRKIEVAPGVALAVTVSGAADGPVVMFSNSLAADQSMWDEVAGALKDRARIVTYDTRGHGQSDISGPWTLEQLGKDALAILDALKIERAIFVGLSLGGLTGMWLAINKPQRVAGLVLANTAANFPPASMWLERAEAARAGGMAQFVNPTLERWLTTGFRERETEATGRIAAMIGATAGQGYAGGCEVLAGGDVLADLAKISCPTRVIVGAHDPSTPPQRGKEIVERVKGAELVELDAAHLSSTEQPAGFTKVIAGLLG